MTYHFSFLFWIQMLYFLFCLFVAFFIPGNFFLKSRKLNSLANGVLSVGVGMSLWGLQGLLFGYLHLRWMSYFYLIVFLILWIRNTPIKIKVPVFHIPKKYFLALLLVVIGCIMQLSTVWFTGTPTARGDYYCCGDNRDNIIHIAFTQSIIDKIPPDEPGMSGKIIQNYHYFSSVIVAELIRVFHLPLIPTDYQYMTVFIAVLLGLSLIVFSQTLDFPLAFTNWLLFFFYFGGDFVYGLRFITTRQLSFSMSSLEDGSKFLANYPRAFAIDMCIVGIILLLLLIRKRSAMVGLSLSIVMGVIIGLKVYVGIFVLVGLFALSCYKILKKDFSFLPYAIGSLLISLALYIPVNSGAGGLYFTGFWIFENYITQPGFGLIRMEMARIIYFQHHNIPRMILYESFYVAIYITTIFWTKLLGLFQTKKSISLFPRELHIFLLSGLAVSFVAGAFFEQTVGTSNTFNFLVNVFILGSFYSALACFAFLKTIPKRLHIILMICIVLLTLPRVVYETANNFLRVAYARGGYTADLNQLTFFSSIKNIIPGNAMVLIDQDGIFSLDKQTPYVYVYIDKNMYLSGQYQELQTHNANYSQRENAIKKLQSLDLCTVAKTILQMPISYIISDKQNYFAATGSAELTSQVYAYQGMSLFKIDKSEAETLSKTACPI